MLLCVHVYFSMSNTDTKLKLVTLCVLSVLLSPVRFQQQVNMLFGKNYHVIPVYSTVFVFVCSFKGNVSNQPTCSCKNACQGQYYFLIFNNE